MSKGALSQVGVSSYISRRPSKNRHPERLKCEQGAEYRKPEMMAKMNSYRFYQFLKVSTKLSGCFLFPANETRADKAKK
jgi:hypothetical protein